MTPQDLSQLADRVGLLAPGNERLRLAFGLACIERVAHLLEDPRAVALLELLGDVVHGRREVALLGAAAREAAQLARSHPGSKSIDGSAHAAVSATHAVAQALGGRPLEAASYAAYAAVYAYGGYAVRDPSAFEPEIAWQAARLEQLAAATAARAA